MLRVPLWRYGLRCHIARNRLRSTQRIAGITLLRILWLLNRLLNLLLRKALLRVLRLLSRHPLILSRYTLPLGYVLKRFLDIDPAPSYVKRFARTHIHESSEPYTNTDLTAVVVGVKSETDPGLSPILKNARITYRRAGYRVHHRLPVTVYDLRRILESGFGVEVIHSLLRSHGIPARIIGARADAPVKRQTLTF